MKKYNTMREMELDIVNNVLNVKDDVTINFNLDACDLHIFCHDFNADNFCIIVANIYCADIFAKKISVHHTLSAQAICTEKIEATIVDSDFAYTPKALNNDEQTLPEIESLSIALEEQELELLEISSQEELANVKQYH